MVMVDFRKRSFIWVVLVVVLVGLGFVYAYNSGDGSIMGHSWDELTGIPSILSDGKISWGEITGIPSDIKDGDDGSSLETKIVTGSTSECRGASTATCPSGYVLVGGGHKWVSTCGCSEDNRYAIASRPNGGNGWVAVMECAKCKAYAVCVKS